MGEWDGKTERRSDNQMMMHLLNNMDKNLALAVQRLETQGVTLDKHIIDDKLIQGELKKSVDAINLKIAQWVGGGAVIMVVGQFAIKALLQ